MVVVLGVTAALVAEPPAKAAAVASRRRSPGTARSARTTIRSSSIRRAPDRTRCTSTCSPRTANPPTSTRSPLAARLPSADVGPLDLRLTPAGPGHATGVSELPLPGAWSFRLDVRKGEFRRVEHRYRHTNPKGLETMKKTLMLAASAVAALIVVGGSAAHVEPAVETAPAGGSTIIPFVVPHGCDGSPTKSVSIQIAAGVTSAKPQAKPGWTLTITRGQAAPAGEGLRRQHRDARRPFGHVERREPAGLAVRHVRRPARDAEHALGRRVYFPTVQRCAKGVFRWIEIPKKGQDEPEHPAPGVALVKSSGDHD